MEVLDCIRNRRSVRSFTDKKVEYDTIKELLEISPCTCENVVNCPYLPLYILNLYQWLAWKISKPAIMIMSVCGLIVGPMFGLIIPEAIIGNSLYKSIISLSVALILFEDSLSLNFEEIRDTKMTIKRIVIYGAFIAWVLGSACAYFVGGLSITTSLVIGAILIVTGPTVILPLLRQAKLDVNTLASSKENTASIAPNGSTSIPR